MNTTESRQGKRMIRGGRVRGKILRQADQPERRGETFEGVVANISAMGLGLDTISSLPDATRVAMVVTLGDGTTRIRFKLRGEVRWRTPPGTEGVHRVGILLSGRPRRHCRRWEEMVFAALRNREEHL